MTRRNARKYRGRFHTAEAAHKARWYSRRHETRESHDEAVRRAAEAKA